MITVLKKLTRFEMDTTGPRPGDVALFGISGELFAYVVIAAGSPERENVYAGVARVVYPVRAISCRGEIADIVDHDDGAMFIAPSPGKNHHARDGRPPKSWTTVGMYYDEAVITVLRPEDEVGG